MLKDSTWGTRAYIIEQCSFMYTVTGLWPQLDVKAAILRVVGAGYVQNSCQPVSSKSLSAFLGLDTMLHTYKELILIIDVFDQYHITFGRFYCPMRQANFKSECWIIYF